MIDVKSKRKKLLELLQKTEYGSVGDFNIQLYNCTWDLTYKELAFKLLELGMSEKLFEFYKKEVKNYINFTINDLNNISYKDLKIEYLLKSVI